MREPCRRGRTTALLAALMTGVFATASVPFAAFAQKPAAAATDKRATARKHYDDGETKFASGDFAGAYLDYKAANDAMPSPQTLYKMAVSLDKGGKADDAAAAYQTFLDAKPPADKLEAKIQDAQARLAVLKKKVRAPSPPAAAGVPVQRSKAACLEAYDKAQSLRSEGHLKAAHEQLLICSQTECPALARKDCMQWLPQVEDAMPTIVVGAKDGVGNDLVDVKVAIDGKPALTVLDGMARPVDPGVHTFRFESTGRTPVEQKVVVREGERSRAINVKFPPRPGEVPAATPAITAGSQRPAEESTVRVRPTGTLVLGYVLGGVGVVAIGGFTYFGLTGVAARDDMRNTCAPHCAQDDVDAAKQKLLIADISLGVGVAALAGATYFLVLRPKSTVVVGAVVPTDGGAYAAVSGRF